ncbi:polysaccharide deacetylase family protein [Paenibacillus sp. BSR1-1]|uniref:polysaccharide deacetylase family protein n=1 Tax=Paenibacillus sp. BSR1-1 TaxID=3020845 RepID=UPI0025AFC203|nr:polysaccharide deacetylase family protein [Paenibacillus sp. BSR1-1]MDN3017912.1 polysaccharide deacetylase family protein [Paenibacillus sp. BSR1-1]
MKFFLSLAIFIIILAQTGIAHGKEPVNNKVLIIYTQTGFENLTQIRILDSLIGHFSNNISIIKDSQIGSVNLEQYTHLFYFGLEQVKVDLRDSIKRFNGPVFIIGKNIEQFGLSFVTAKGETLIKAVSLKEKGLTIPLPEERLALKMEADSTAQVLLEGMNKEGKNIPLLIRKDRFYYLASESLFNPIGNFLGEVLFPFFNHPKNNLHNKYLRLEDINPKTDPDRLMEIAKYLKEKNIPYIISLIPVYSDAKSKTEVHLSDSPKLVKTLRFMQNHGGSIILHGYRHKYKDSETGEGFEFWDVENDRPIFQEKDEAVKKRQDFHSEEEYIKNSEDFERKYIETIIEKGIQELVTHKLYPLAFEAPHYAMSETGYQVLSKHFSTYVGHIQLTDQSWQGVYAPLFETEPSYLHGMKVLPETVGYVVDGDKNSINEIEKKYLINENFSDAYISGFYHPYLGLQKLKSLVTAFESVPNTEWLDLKMFDNRVSVPGITITSENGKMTVNKDFISSEYERNNFLKKLIPWTVSSGLIIIFIIYAILARRNRQRQ